MPWKEMSVMDQKKEFILLWKSNRYTLTELSNIFEVSRPTLYKYLHRYQDYGMKGLEELSRVPKTIAVDLQIKLNNPSHIQLDNFEMQII